MKTLKEKENPLLARKEVLIELDFEGATPKRSELAKKVGETYKLSAEHVTIRQIRTLFGQQKAVVTANIYKKADDKAKYEARSFLSKGVPKEKKAEGA